MPDEPPLYPRALCPDCLHEVFGLVADLTVIAADISAVLAEDRCPLWDDIVRAIGRALERAAVIESHVEACGDHEDEDGEG